jgi:riboflavin biosynthesis pyrimidine reductase
MAGMRELLPTPRSDVDVHESYAAGWVDRGGFRLNMIASVDGAASANGFSRGLQTPGDNRIFAALRDLADVVLAGSGTIQAERYGPANLDDARLARREAYGFGPALPVGVISRSLRLDLSARLFQDPERRPFVITCGDTVPDELAAVAEVLVCGETDIDYGLVRGELAARGLTRVLCEGGPTILGSMLRAGAVDELCLSVSPFVMGPGAPRIVDGRPWPDGPATMRLGTVLEEEGALFLRYHRFG